MKKVYLVRHGQTDVNKNKILQGGRVNASINETGRKQTEAFYQMYKNIPFQKIYTSELKRSIESVQAFINQGIPHESLPELNEIDYGIYDGKIPSEDPEGTYQYLVNEWVNGNTALKPEGGESPEDVQQRMKKFIDILRSQPEETPILISMHGRALRILLVTMLHYPLKHMQLFPHENFGLYILNYSGHLFTIEKFNDTSHLHESSDTQPLKKAK